MALNSKTPTLSKLTGNESEQEHAEETEEIFRKLLGFLCFLVFKNEMFSGTNSKVCH